jgi:UrcA family protein
MFISRRAMVLAMIVMADSCVPSCIRAVAASGREPPSIRVSVRDLDLTTDRGAAAAYSRIRNAARTVCGAVGVSPFAEERALRDQCVDEAIATAVTKLGSANVAEYYLAKTHSARAHLAVTAQIPTPTNRGR